MQAPALGRVHLFVVIQQRLRLSPQRRRRRRHTWLHRGAREPDLGAIGRHERRRETRAARAAFAALPHDNEGGDKLDPGASQEGHGRVVQR